MLTNQLGHACCQIMTKANCLATRQSCLSIVIILKAMQTNFGNFYFRWRIIRTDELVPFCQLNVRPSGPNVRPLFSHFEQFSAICRGPRPNDIAVIMIQIMILIVMSVFLERLSM